MRLQSWCVAPAQPEPVPSGVRTVVVTHAGGQSIVESVAVYARPNQGVFKSRIGTGSRIDRACSGLFSSFSAILIAITPSARDSSFAQS